MGKIYRKTALKALLRCHRGATAVEYGLILALIVLAIMAAVQQFASKANGMWSNIANEVNKH